MANSSMDIVFSYSSVPAPNSRRCYPTPTNSCNHVYFSVTASTSHTHVRAPPASPFFSNHEHCWREEISWQIEPNERLNHPKTLGSALSPWGWSSSSPSGLSQTFRRTPNDPHLPRTYENEKIRLRSYAASERETGNTEVDVEGLQYYGGGGYYSENDSDEKVKVSGRRRRVGLMGLFRYTTKWDMVVASGRGVWWGDRKWGIGALLFICFVSW